MVNDNEIKTKVLVESIKQHSNRRITNKVIRICEKYVSNVIIDWKDEDENKYWITGITLTDENGNDRKVAIASENEFNKMVNEIFN